ncbi:MAG TPA: L-threonylcarbamoyladenylate synthase [Chitinophagaceae bacterium]|jgi:L-threonylcarbamoyladenylate synthase|nr:L-threonylcarbamoyladenylate synthase [Chitinophagaceae bacterium]
MNEPFLNDIETCLAVLRSGGLILYPTDTVWGIGCDATNADAVRRVYDLKQRDDSKSLILLLAEEREVLQYTAAPDLAVFDFLETQERPTTIIFDGAVGLPDNVIAADGSIALRLTTDAFCRHLIRRLRRPLVSTSANISGTPTPRTYAAITEAIRAGVDYVVHWRRDDTEEAQPSRIIRWKGGGKYDVIRG